MGLSGVPNPGDQVLAPDGLVWTVKKVPEKDRQGNIISPGILCTISDHPPAVREAWMLLSTLDKPPV